MSSAKSLETRPEPRKVLHRDLWELQIAQVSDSGFIIDSWCADEALYVGRQSNEEPDVGKAGMRGRINRLIQACPCVVVRPTAEWFRQQGKPVDSKFLFGFISYSFDRATNLPIVHFLYIKAEFRQQGLANALLYAAGLRDKGAWCTHNRLRFGKTMRRKGISYNKYLLDYDPAAKPKLDDPYRPSKWTIPPEFS